MLERPKVAAHGDIACNAAMQLAKPLKTNPRELAQRIVDALMAAPGARDLIESAEIAGPGFINLRLANAAKQAAVAAVLSAGEGPNPDGVMHDELKGNLGWQAVEYLPKKHYDRATGKYDYRANRGRPRTVPPNSWIHESAFQRRDYKPPKPDGYQVEY